MKCAVLSCKHDSRKHKKKNFDISFHRFPKNMEMTKKWVKAINRPNWEPNIWSCICSLHFNPSSIAETKQGLRKLAEGSIPKLHIQVQPNYASDVDPSPMVVDAEDYTLGHNDSPQNTRNEVKKMDFITEVAPSSNTTVFTLGEFIVNSEDTPCKIRLIRRIVHIQETAKRRRLRCNALLAQKTRLRKKADSLTKMVEELKEIAKRQRWRCSAFLAQKRCLKTKVESLTKMVDELQQNGLDNSRP